MYSLFILHDTSLPTLPNLLHPLITFPPLHSNPPGYRIELHHITSQKARLRSRMQIKQ
ncbi:hypothetical protein BJX99DRAFT_241253 [Aspergillus californicus]